MGESLNAQVERMYEQKKWKTARFEKGTRYYTLYLKKDLLDDWVVVRVNGRIDTRLGGVRQEIHGSYQNALSQFNALFQYRIASRRYEYVPPLNIKNRPDDRVTTQEYSTLKRA